MAKTETSGLSGTRPRGICWVCVYGGDCTLAANHDRPVIQCAQFEPFPAPSGETAGQPIETRQKPSAVVTDSVEYLGLCKTCENRADCTFPRGEGGVWHCDEYV